MGPIHLHWKPLKIADTIDIFNIVFDFTERSYYPIF